MQLLDCEPINYNQKAVLTLKSCVVEYLTESIFIGDSLQARARV